MFPEHMEKTGLVIPRAGAKRRENRHLNSYIRYNYCAGRLNYSAGCWIQLQVSYK